ncbi:hypothetical protein C8Q69DRAFT_134813 [Paecilomyces variotii]|uniref:Uncharacterized protein n=1 Tax=Byssochlamys spectabilis TaxID=264951 RepID=A0A443I007_BYSSP|nr:hypothetical protein C8Q69DRAFT_134813 [Paecilomyces variotii]RWQ97396.1 hypothetical protein C8Q69DRAFT_134813 [Paecilomyces variotii]
MATAVWENEHGVRDRQKHRDAQLHFVLRPQRLPCGGESKIQEPRQLDVSIYSFWLCLVPLLSLTLSVSEYPWLCLMVHALVFHGNLAGGTALLGNWYVNDFGTSLYVFCHFHVSILLPLLLWSLSSSESMLSPLVHNTHLQNCSN